MGVFGFKTKFLRSLDITLDNYLLLAEILNDGDEKLYNNILKKIEKERKIQKEIYESANYGDIIDEATIELNSVSNSKGLVSSEYIVFFNLILKRVSNMFKFDENLESDEKAFTDDYNINKLIALKEMYNLETDPLLKKRYLESYFLFIFTLPDLEEEFLSKDGRINIPSMKLRRVARITEDDDIIDVIDATFTKLMDAAISLFNDCFEFTTDPYLFHNQKMLESTIASLLMNLNKEEILEFKETCEEYFEDSSNEYARKILLEIIKHRLDTYGTQKVIRIF